MNKQETLNEMYERLAGGTDVLTWSEDASTELGLVCINLKSTTIAVAEVTRTKNFDLAYFQTKWIVNEINKLARMGVIDCIADWRKRNDRIYLSGPMSGIAEHNYPAFRAASAKLREEGYLIFDPSTNDATLPRWLLMTIDLIQVIKADAIYVLPGWKESCGAQLEVLVGLECGKKVVDFITRQEIREHLIWKQQKY